MVAKYLTNTFYSLLSKFSTTFSTFTTVLSNLIHIYIQFSTQTIIK